MNNEATEVQIDHLPTCRFCGNTAGYDGQTHMGSWAYMCEDCFQIYGVGLGMGRGQKLICLEEDDVEEDLS